MSRSSRTCRRAAQVRWTVETHPTLIYCRSRQHVLGSLVANSGGGFDLRAPDAADAVAHINDLLRVDGGIVTPIYYWMCINTEIAPSHNNQIRKLLDAGADPEKRSTFHGHVDTLLFGVVRSGTSLWERHAALGHGWAVIISMLQLRGANFYAVSTKELKTRFGMLPHQQTALGLAIFDQGLRRMQDDRVLTAQQVLIGELKRLTRRITDGDYFCLWVDRARRWDRKFLDEKYGAALTPQNRWSFPPCYFRTARMLGIETKTRDGVLGVGLCHEMALLRRIYAYLGRADVVGFFPEKLETVLYSAKESKKYRNRGRRDKYCS
jgi:hypothetical protein